MRDPIIAIQSAIRDTWAYDPSVKIYFESDPESAVPDLDEYMILEFGEAKRGVVTNISRIWSVPVTFNLYGVSSEAVSDRSNAIANYLLNGESSIGAHPISFGSSGNLISVVTESSRVMELDPMRWQASWESLFTFRLPR